MHRWTATLLLLLGLPLAMRSVRADDPGDPPKSLTMPGDAVDGEAAVSWARRQLRQTSGVWLPPGSGERALNDLAVKVLRDAKGMNSFIAELEQERTDADAMTTDPPVEQVLAGLYAWQAKGDLKRQRYVEAWRKKPDDPWLNLKAAEQLHLSMRYDEMMEALALVWKQAPEMVLFEAGRVGSWYAASGRLDGVAAAIQALPSRSPPLDDGPQWERFLAALQTGQLTAEQLAPVERAVAAVISPVMRIQMALQQGAALMRDRKFADAYDVYAQQVYFSPDLIAPAASASAEASAVAPRAVRSVANFVTAAQQTQRLEALVKDAQALRECSEPWKSVGEVLLAIASEKQGNRQPLLDLARRVRGEPLAAPFGDSRVVTLQQALSDSSSSAALELCLEWKQADESRRAAAGAALGLLRHEQALLCIRLGRLSEARSLWLSAVQAPTSDAELTALNISADQLRLHKFYIDALPLYRQLLHDWLPAYPDGPLKQQLLAVERHTVGLILGKLQDQWREFKPDEQQALLEALLDLLFSDGRDAEPVLPINADPPAAAADAVRPDLIPELAPAILRLAAASNRLEPLRTAWAQHPAQNSVAVLTLRAEAAAAADDQQELGQLMARVPQIEQDSGRSPRFWSVKCVLFGAGDNFHEACTFDFRERKLDRKVLNVCGLSPWLVKPEQEGLRIRLPANAGAIGHVGVNTRFRMHGDFEAVATYELLKIDNPTPPKFYGGAMLLAEFADSPEHVNLRRERHPNGADVYTSHHHSVNAQEQTQTVMPSVPTQATRGQIALLRHGTKVYWLVKDEGESEFRVLLQDKCTPRDVSTLKLAIDSFGTQNLTDIRWLDLSLRAEKFLDLPAEYLQRPSDVAAGAAPSPEKSRRWLYWGAGLLATTGIVVFAALRYRS